MASVTKIQLSDKGYLDVQDDVNIPLTFALSDIKDISKRNSSYSKTIRLAGTSNNNILLGMIFNVNVFDSSFNQAKTERCTIYQNDVPIMNGVFRLNNVNIDGDKIDYEAEVRDDSGDFYSTISDKLLTDLEGFEQYNHIYQPSAVLYSFNNTYRNGYKYHLMYNTKPWYKLEDFTPNIFAKTYFDAIFQDAGFSYKWDSLEELNFDKLIIPYNGAKPVTNLDLYRFRAGMNDDGQIMTTYYDDRKSAMNFNQTNFNTPPLKNPNNYYSTTSGTWTSPFSGATNKFKVRYNYVSYLYSPVNLYVDCSIAIGNYLGYGYLNRTLSHYIGDSNTNQFIPLTNSVFAESHIRFSSTDGNLYIPAGEHFPMSGLTPEFIGETDLQVGQKITNYLSCEIKRGATGGANNGYYDHPPFNASFQFRYNNSSGAIIPVTSPDYPVLRTYIGAAIIGENIDNEREYFYNEPIATFQQGMTVNIPDFIPAKIKQKDFLKAISQMYNLYITPSKENDRQLVIRTRNEFYNGGDVKDWSNKLDVSQNIKVEFLPDLQNKKILFTYKADTDLFNKTYTDTVGEIYGQAEYTFQSEYAKDTLTIGNTLFSPTPLANNGGQVDISLFPSVFSAVTTDLIVPTINCGEPKNNIRILYDGGNIDGAWGFNYGNFGYSTTIFYVTYPYLGHFYPNPILPTEDLNWGLCDYQFYDNWSGLTNNNLYNRHYSRYINQIETGKLLTGKFKLDEIDIVNLDFRDKIWLNDSYWFINKITDYNANENGLTAVELISVDEGTIFAPNNNII